jgi:hypothetical protein
LARLPFSPPGFVTATVTAPAACAGVVAVIVVPLTTTTFVAAVPPNVTVAPEVKPVPVIVTAVPPPTGPLIGETLVTVGEATYVKPFIRLPACPPGLVTVTVTAPTLPAGVVAVMLVLLTTTTFVAAALPNVTVAPATKFVPVMVTAVPPAVDPLLGDTLVTVGIGPDTAENVTICITQGPAPTSVAVALLLPAAVTTLSSARSESGFVMIREVKPVPAAAFPVATMLAQKINSFALVVVADPLLALALLPLAPAVTSSVVIPRYSNTRTSGNAAAWLNVTVTVLLPPTILAA